MVKVSVLLPAYNHEAYIERTVSSILSQQEQSLELIAVDDGSTDATGRLLDKMAEFEPRLKVVHKQNGGVAAALNDAMDRATGEWIATCGSDDMVPANAYSDLLRMRHNADVLIGEFTEIEDSGRQTRVRLGARIGKSGFEALFAMPATWNKLIRRELLVQNGIRFPDVTICEDLIFLAQVAACSPRCAFTPKSVYLYRNNPDGASMTHNYSAALFAAHVRGRERVLDICEEAGIAEGYAYVYRDSLDYLAQFIQKLDVSEMDRALEALKRLLCRGESRLDEERIERLFFLSADELMRIDAVAYDLLLRRMPPEQRVLNRLASGEIGLRFVLRCAASWLHGKKRQR